MTHTSVNGVQVLSDEATGTTVASLNIFIHDTNTGMTFNRGFTGASRVTEPDEYDSGIGTQIALGRALVASGRQLIKEGYKEVWRRDRLRRRQIEAQEASKAKKTPGAKYPGFIPGERVWLIGEPEMFGTVVDFNRVKWDHHETSAIVYNKDLYRLV